MWYETEKEAMLHSQELIVPKISMWVTPMDPNFFVNNRVLTFHERSLRYKISGKWSPVDLPLQPQKD